MTEKDLHLLYQQDTGKKAPTEPQVLDGLYGFESLEYILWLQQNLIMMTDCVDQLTTAVKKVTILMNRTNPLIG